MNNYKSIIKLIPYIREKKSIFFWGIFGISISSLLYLPVPYITGNIVGNLFVTKSSLKEIIFYCLFVLFLYILKFFITIFSKSLFIKLQIIITNKIRIDMIKKIIDLPMEYFNSNENGYILSRINECSNIGNIFSPNIISVLLSQLECIFTIITMFILNVNLSLFLFIMLPIIFFITKYFSELLNKNTRKLLDKNAYLNSGIFEMLNGIVHIKYLNAKDIYINKLKNKINDVVLSTTSQNKSIMFFTENMSLINNVFTILLMLISSFLIFDNKITLALYVSFSGYLVKVISNIQSFANLGITIKPICVSIDRVTEFFSLEDEFAKKEIFLNESIKSIEFLDLNFKYNSNDEFLFNDINFELYSNDKILLMGDNGSGKSTLIKLLLELYKNYKGNIIINGYNLRKINPLSLRKRIGIVSQDIFLFKGTVLENILYNNDNCNEKDVENLINRLGIKDYINNFNNGLKTELIGNNNGISGGQKQIIAFLRAILNKKDVLILDEDTSNIDNKTKNRINLLLETNQFCNILIIISHEDRKYKFINKIIYINKELRLC